MTQKEKYKKLLESIELSADLPEESRVSFVNLLNKLIRNDELLERSNDYVVRGYNLGYFLIQSQKVEQVTAGAIESAEALRASISHREKEIIDINKPLGQLIAILKTYIRGDDIFTPLAEFNEYRKLIIHRLDRDYSRDLRAIEISIASDYPPSRFINLQNILLEVSSRIGMKIVEQMDESMTAKGVGKKLGDVLIKEIGLSNLKFEILSDPRKTHPLHPST